MQAGGMTESYDVAIVGFGPVGATLAALLGQRGRRVAVLDKSERIYPLPRAFALDHEAMRIFQQIGIADELAPHMTPYRPTFYLGADGEPIQHFDMGAPPYPLAWAPAYTFNQPALETALRRTVAAQPTVTVRLGTEAVDVRQEDGGAALRVRTQDGREAIWRARYVVACDGGSSPLRKLLGLRLRSLEFDEPWIVVDLHVHDDQLARLPATNVQYCDPARPCTYVVGPGTHRRWEFLLLPDEAERRDTSDEAIWKLLAPWLSPGQARIWRAAAYRFHAVVLEQWRRGAVLLAGDAAHQMPPFLAQGMCQGLRDAANLAWKLDWVLAGRAAASLLDTYGAERGPQVEETTATVKRLGRIICERDPGRARERDRELRGRQDGQVRPQLRQSLLPGIRHGLVDGDRLPAGTPFPQPLCRTDAAQPPRRMDDLLAHSFVLALRSPPDAGMARQWAECLRVLDATAVCFESAGPSPAPTGIAVLDEADGIMADWFARHECDAALVRPDRVVYGTARRLADVLQLLQGAVRRLEGLKEASDTTA